MQLAMTPTEIAQQIRDSGKKIENNAREGVPFDEYRRIPAINQSKLKQIERSDLHFCHAWVNDHGPIPKQSRPTPEMQLGTAIHARLLEPETFEHQVKMLDADRRTKAGKAEYEAMIADNPDAIIMKPGEYERCLMASQSAQAVLDNWDITKTETTLTWSDAGLPYKARLDAIARSDHDRATVIDIKTTSEPALTYRAMQRYAVSFGLWQQAGFYRIACREALGVDVLTHMIIFVQTAEPYQAVAMQLLDLTAAENMAHGLIDKVETLTNALSQGAEPSHYDGPAFLSMPEWLQEAQ